MDVSALLPISPVLALMLWATVQQSRQLAAHWRARRVTVPEKVELTPRCSHAKWVEVTSVKHELVAYLCLNPECDSEVTLYADTWIDAADIWRPPGCLCRPLLGDYRHSCPVSYHSGKADLLGAPHCTCEKCRPPAPKKAPKKSAVLGDYWSGWIDDYCKPCHDDFALDVWEVHDGAGDCVTTVWSVDSSIGKYAYKTPTPTPRELRQFAEQLLKKVEDDIKAQHAKSLRYVDKGWML